ncbi:ribonuclease Y [Hypnocyclicus thermotrophus]|uniref:Ribonuclease Y n=1 Tax=Hypnocyclicus thermotrophus TaxID=1627895 RepID=A0AA46I583_9FUSO|nr:ribonuclease Y [Hypnocyclicus thermotrophus]TDT69167.1 ribonuclease Y [Hypnocyclicus thermotrophus]
MNIVLLASATILVAGIFLALYYKKKNIDSRLEQLKGKIKELENAKIEAEDIVETAKKKAQDIKRETEIKTKEKIYKMKEEAEKEIKAAKIEIDKKEQRIIRKEENVDNKLEKIETKEKHLEEKSRELNVKIEEIEKLKEKQELELERVAELSKQEAKEILLDKIKEELTHETAVVIREYENKLEDNKERISKRILSTAISKAASEYVVDATISVVQLPNEEMKGRIIGREGRNIRAIEALTGVDVIIDDTPEAVVVSSFDGVRREIAKLALEKLVQDGRIHPAKIEESVDKATKEVNQAIVEAGEQALFELGITDMHPEIIKTLGRLKYRTSYGQNVLVHSIEVANLASTLAAELGCNVELAKRSGLLHDIGKALDHDIEGSHAIIGAEFLKKFGEKENVYNGAAAHHGEEEFTCVESVLVQAADAISASRPGARRETLSTYLKRLENLEEIATSFEGVESSYAIQAGREIRIIVNAEEINDDKATIMSREVAKKIEERMQYPGQIKVTVVRETRAVEYAK